MRAKSTIATAAAAALSATVTAMAVAAPERQVCPGAATDNSNCAAPILQPEMSAQHLEGREPDLHGEVDVRVMGFFGFSDTPGAQGFGEPDDPSVGGPLYELEPGGVSSHC